MDDSPLIDKLRLFGLTDKEIQTYLVLLQEGETVVSRVAERAGVSKRHVYNTASKLEDRKLIEVHDFVTPTRLRPVSPDQVKRLFIQEINELHDILESRFNRSQFDLTGVDVLKSRSTMIKRIGQIISSASHKVMIVVPVSILPDLEAELARAVERDVLVLLLLTSGPAEAIESDLSRLAHVGRINERRLAIQLAVDNSCGLIAPHSILSNKPGSETRAIVLGSEEIEPVLLNAFSGNVWPYSTEIHVREPDDLPKTYTSHHLSVLQATLTKAADTRVFAETKVYDKRDANGATEDGPVDADGGQNYSITTLDGEVVNTRQWMTGPEADLPVATIELAVDGDVVQVGGRRCVYEEYQAIQTHLYTR
jgi:sugar-specific transcriptional regulator TrmB